MKFKTISIQFTLNVCKGDSCSKVFRKVQSKFTYKPKKLLVESKFRCA